MKFKRAGKMSIEEGMELIRAHMQKSKSQQKKRVMVLGHEVALNSLRLYTFATTPACCANPECGMRATHFAVEIQTKDGQPVNSHYQLNMYGEDQYGHRILMTHDHTLARCLGGVDGLSNTSTMCKNCNQRKSIFESQEVERRRAAEAGNPVPRPTAPATMPPDRAMQYLVDLTRMAQSKEMSVEEYLDHCDLHGTALGPPLHKWADKDKEMARSLGLSRAGLRLYKKHRDELLRPGVELVVEPEAVFEVDPETLCPMRHRNKRHAF